MTSRFSKLSLFLNKHENEWKKKYIHLRVSSREMMPEDLRNMKIVDLPPKYQAPSYICPNTMQFDIYETESALNVPVDLSLLLSCAVNVERIHMNMYPGGSGLEVFFL